jgi:putative tricarboxylic transport membrane protein
MNMARLAGRLNGRSELGVAGLLLALGGVVLWDAARIGTDFAQRGPIGPTLMPAVVGLMLVVCAVLLARDVLRGGHGEEEAGEDVDLTHGSDWRTVLLLGGAFLANAALIERTGWVISGAVLFWGAARALGSRRLVRDALVAVGLSTVTFYVFAVGLGIHLPAGWLQGVL